MLWENWVCVDVYFNNVYQSLLLRFFIHFIFDIWLTKQVDNSTENEIMQFCYLLMAPFIIEKLIFKKTRAREWFLRKSYLSIDANTFLHFTWVCFRELQLPTFLPQNIVGNKSGSLRPQGGLHCWDMRLPLEYIKVVSTKSFEGFLLVIHFDILKAMDTLLHIICVFSVG